MNAPNEPKRFRLLVVDDNRAIHEDFRKILAPDMELKRLDQIEADLFGKTIEPPARQDFEIDSAYQGEEGLALVQDSLDRKSPYSLAFIDMRMPPGWNGMETIEHIWNIDPVLQIVICSAYSDHSWAEISQRLGNNDRLLILKKPFDNVEILQMAYAMSTKCEMARTQSTLRKNSTTNNNTTSANATQADSLDDAINDKLIGPIKEIKESVYTLQKSFENLNNQFDNLRNILVKDSNRISEQKIQDLLNSLGMPELEQNIPDTFHRIHTALNKVYRDTDQISDNPDKPVH